MKSSQIFSKGNGCLIMLLDAPYQSWGASSRFLERTTLNHPTKSGIVGIICAAMGIERNNLQIIKEISDLKIDFVCFYENGYLNKDFHTIGGGYSKDESEFIPHRKDGTVKGTVVTNRYYLCDHKFVALVFGNLEGLNQIAKALRNPKWTLYLGRKTCIPSDIIFQSISKSKDETKDFLLKYSQRKRLNYETAKVIFEDDDGSEEIMDVPISFENRKYRSRNIEETYAKEYFDSL